MQGYSISFTISTLYVLCLIKRGRVREVKRKKETKRKVFKKGHARNKDTLLRNGRKLAVFSNLFVQFFQFQLLNFSSLVSIYSLFSVP